MHVAKKEEKKKGQKVSQTHTHTYLCFKQFSTKERPLPGHGQINPDALRWTPTPERGPASRESLQQLSVGQKDHVLPSLSFKTLLDSPSLEDKDFFSFVFKALSSAKLRDFFIIWLY